MSEPKIPAGIQMLLKAVGIKPEEMLAQVEGVTKAADVIVKKLNAIESMIADVQKRVKHLESCVEEPCNTVTPETLLLPQTIEG